MASRTGSGTVAVLAAPETARPNARTAATRSRLFIQASLDRNRSDPLVADVLGAFDLDPPKFVGVRPPQEANELFIDGDALARADVLVALLVDYLELKRVVAGLGLHTHILTGSLAAVEPFLNRAWFPPRLPASESKERTMTGMMIFNLIAAIAVARGRRGQPRPLGGFEPRRRAPPRPRRSLSWWKRDAEGPSAGVAAALAAPACFAFPRGDGGNHKRGGRISPPPSRDGVQEQPTEHRHRA